MPEDSMEKRVSDLERGQDLISHQLTTITTGITEIKTSLAIANGLAGKLQTAEVRIEAAWKKIDGFQIMKDEFQLVKVEHMSFKPKVEAMDVCAMGFEHRLKTVETKLDKADQFLAGRFSSLIDKILPWAIGMLAFFAVTKGWVKP